jgi:ABC-2 type transport system permease protein
MGTLFRSEFRKLLTIRSTYILMILATLLLGFFSFWALGYKGVATANPVLMQAVMDGVTVVAMFISIIAVLNVTHEYRYNTIMYTLTSANSRTKVFLAKLGVILAFVLGFFVFASLFAVLMTWIGATMSGNTPINDTFYFTETIWRSLFHITAMTLLGFMFGMLFRHVVGAIAVLFIVPNTIEGLLSIVMKENTKYLPYSAIEQVHSGALLAPNKAALVASAYIIGGLIIAWILFLRRDAN